MARAYHTMPGLGDIWGSPSGDAAEDFDDLTDDELEERRAIIEQERAERELGMTTLSIRQLDPEGRGTFAAMRRKRLAMAGHCPLIAAQHNDPRFTEPPPTRPRVDLEQTIRMTRSELDDILWGTL